MGSPHWKRDEQVYVAELYHQGLRGDDLISAHNERFPEIHRSEWALENAVYYRDHAVEYYRELQEATSGSEVEATWEPEKGLLRSDDVRTLDQLLEAADLDPREWSVQYVKPKAWQVGAKLANEDGVERLERKQLHGIEAKLKRLVSVDALRDLKDSILEDIARQGAPTPVEPKDDGEYLLALNLPDLHLNLLAWSQETGEPWDLEIAVEAFRDAVEDLTSKALRYGTPNRVLLVVGNDFFHTDQTVKGKTGATTRGTPQETDVRWKLAFRTGRTLLSETIRQLSALAPVDIIVVPGNHDEHKTWFLGEVLAAEFEAVEGVRLDNRPLMRKPYRYGSTLFGLSHGKEEKLKEIPNLMSTEWPEAWGETRYREWYLGHQHHDEVHDLNGVRVRKFPSLAGTDEYHARSGHVEAVRSAFALMYHPVNGYEAQFAHTYELDTPREELIGVALDGTP